MAEKEEDSGAKGSSVVAKAGVSIWTVGWLFFLGLTLGLGEGQEEVEWYVALLYAAFTYVFWPVMLGFTVGRFLRLAEKAWGV